MIAYLAFVRQVVGKLKGWSISHIPREKNFEVDRLARLASSIEEDLGGIRVEYFPEPSVTTRSRMDINEVTLGPSWLDSIMAFLSTWKLPADKVEAR